MPIGDTREIWSRTHQAKISVPRLAWLLAHPGQSLAPHRIAFRCCTSYDCVAPKHIKSGTKKDWGRAVMANGRSATPAKVAACRVSAANSPHRKLTDELKQWIVESSQSAPEIASAIGCSKTIVVSARKAQALRPAASIFDFAMRTAA